MTALAPDPELLPTADEPTLLHSFLEYYRSIFVRKAEGLTEAQVRLQLGPSELTMLGLVRHMTEVERGWFRRRFMALDAPPLYYDDSDPDGDFHPMPTDTMPAALAALQLEIDFARLATAGMAMDALAMAVPTAQHSRLATVVALDPGAHDRGVRPAPARRPVAPSSRRRNRD
jgi:hypothetical protein